MEHVTLEELEDIARKAKTTLYCDGMKDVTIAVEVSAFSNAQIIVKEDGQTYIPSDSDLGSCQEVRIAAIFDEAPTEEQESAIAGVIAVIADVFGAELDGEHVSLPDELDAGEVMERAEWLLECGLESED